MFAMPPVTRALIIANVALYLLELWVAPFLLLHFALWPLASEAFRPWQILTYAFLHDPSSVWHIFFNMFALYMFGRALESFWGSRRFLIYFLVCVLAAGATQLIVTRFTPDAGFTVEMPLLPGHGTDISDMVPTRWPQWCEAADDAFTELAARCDAVAVVGLSMGGSLAVCTTRGATSVG